MTPPVGTSAPIERNVTRGHGTLELYLARQRIRTAERFIPDACRYGRLLDIGCGAYPLFLVSTKFTEKHGVDQFTNDGRKELLDGTDVHYRVADFESSEPLPFSERYFDVVTMLAVIEHLQPSSAAHVLREAYRVLRPGGRFIMTSPSTWADPVLRMMVRLGLASSLEVRDHQYYYNRRTTWLMLAVAGFDCERIRIGFFEAFMNMYAVAEK